MHNDLPGLEIIEVPDDLDLETFGARLMQLEVTVSSILGFLKKSSSAAQSPLNGTRRKLTQKDAALIRGMLNLGMSGIGIARHTGFNSGIISKIKAQKLHSQIQAASAIETIQFLSTQ